MQDLDNRKTLATKCKGETPIKNNSSSPKFSSLYTVYYKNEHLTFGLIVLQQLPCVQCQFNCRYLTHLLSLHTHTVYKNKHGLGSMNQCFNNGVKSLTDIACPTSKVSCSERFSHFLRYF